MHERIKEVRKHVKMSQKEFGESLGVSRDVLANIENNRVEPKETFIKLLCTEYNVNEMWLRTGNGEMLNELSPDDEFSMICMQIENTNDERAKKLLRTYWSLDESAREVIRNLIDSLEKK